MNAAFVEARLDIGFMNWPVLDAGAPAPRHLRPGPDPDAAEGLEAPRRVPGRHGLPADPGGRHDLCRARPDPAPQAGSSTVTLPQPFVKDELAAATEQTPVGWLNYMAPFEFPDRQGSELQKLLAGDTTLDEYMPFLQKTYDDAIARRPSRPRPSIAAAGSPLPAAAASSPGGHVPGATRSGSGSSARQRHAGRLHRPARAAARPRPDRARRRCRPACGSRRALVTSFGIPRFTTDGRDGARRTRSVDAGGDPRRRIRRMPPLPPARSQARQARPGREADGDDPRGRGASGRARRAGPGLLVCAPHVVLSPTFQTHLVAAPTRRHRPRPPRPSPLRLGRTHLDQLVLRARRRRAFRCRPVQHHRPDWALGPVRARRRDDRRGRSRIGMVDGRAGRRAGRGQRPCAARLRRRDLRRRDGRLHDAAVPQPRDRALRLGPARSRCWATTGRPRVTRCGTATSARGGRTRSSTRAGPGPMASATWSTASETGTPR